MGRKVTPLTNTEVKNAKPKDKMYKLSDGAGLQLRVMPTGAKQWLLDYIKPITKKRSALSLGSYPGVSLAEARRKRDKARQQIADNIDPKEARDDELRQQQLSASYTFQRVANDWFAVKKTKIAETTSRSLWRNFENHLFPKIGHRAIDKLLAPEVIDVLRPLAVRGTLETIDKVIGHLNEVMTFAVNTGRIHHNPLAGIRAAFETPKAQNMLALKPSELPEFMSALNYASIKITTRCLIEWQLHTMVRPSEAASAQWSEIDLENALWNIPAERMKMKREHIVPLTKQTLEILERMKPISFHRQYVFPADRKPKEPCNSSTANMAIKRMGFKGRLVAHGMRSIASTALNEFGHDADVIEAALAHIDKNEVRRAYNRSEYLTRRMALMAWWSGFIEAASQNRLEEYTLVKIELESN